LIRINCLYRALFIVAICGFAFAADAKRGWYQFHGPNRDNICTETGLLKRWPEGGPKLLWTAKDLGKGFSSMSIVDDTIFIVGKVGVKTVIFALDMDGRLKWQKENGESWEANPRHRWAVGHSGSRCTPTIDDGVAYQLNDLGRLVALDASTGREIWSVLFSERFGAKRPQWAYAESPLVDGDRLYCYPGGPKGYMVALDKKTGETIWANTKIGERASYCSNILVECEGIRQLITMTESSVIGVAPKDGELLWKYPFRNRRGINISYPIYRDGRVVVSSGYGKGTLQARLTRQGEVFQAEETWTSAAPDNHHGGLVLIGDYLYGSGNVAKGWTCLNFLTGEVSYTADPQGKGSVLYADGMLYCLDERGTMELVPVDPAKRQVVSSFRVPRGGDSRYWAHPVIHNGILYVRHDAHLYAYDIRANQRAVVRTSASGRGREELRAVR